MYLKVWKDLVPLSAEVRFSSWVPETLVTVPQRSAAQGGSTEVLVQHLHLVGQFVELLCAVQVWSPTIPCCNYLTEIMNLPVSFCFKACPTSVGFDSPVKLPQLQNSSILWPATCLAGAEINTFLQQFVEQIQIQIFMLVFLIITSLVSMATLPTGSLMTYCTVMLERT